MQAPADRRQQMLALVREWRQSGLIGREFAASHGVTLWTLQYWREQLRKEEGRPAPPVRLRRRRVEFAPVHVVPAADSGGGDLEILLAGGDRIRLAASVEPDRLRRVLEMLRGRC
jgi:hypothetical protein